MSRKSTLERLAPQLPPGVTADAKEASITLTIDGEAFITVTGASLETAYIKAVRMLPTVSQVQGEMLAEEYTQDVAPVDEASEGHPDQPLAYINGGNRYHDLTQYRRDEAEARLAAKAAGANPEGGALC